MNRTRFCGSLALFVLAVFSTPAVAEGLADELPGMAPGCPALDALELSRAGDAVKAAYLPLQPLVQANVFGVQLYDDPRAIEVVRRSLGVRPPPGWSNASRCTNSICALRAALGGSWEGALWMLAIGARGIVASVDQSPWAEGKISIWQAGELRSIYGALADLPPVTLAHAPFLRALRRAPEGDPVMGPNGNAVSERGEGRLGGLGSIIFRDTVFKMRPKQKREVLAHELGHHLDYAAERATNKKYALSHSSEWLGFGGWALAKPDGDRDLPSGYRLTANAENAWTMFSWPSEEMANSIAEYRYQARLFRDYSPEAYAYAGRYFDREYIKPAPDADLDAMIEKAGGRIALFHACAAMVTHTFERSDFGPAQITIVHTQADGSKETATVDRWGFVAHTPCVFMSLTTLQAQAGWQEAMCRRDPEELWIRLAERLEEVEDSVYEGVHAVLAARTPQALESCFDKRDLGKACLEGPRGVAVANAEARRVVKEFSKPGAGNLAGDQVAEMQQAILDQTPLAPADGDWQSKIPLLSDGKEMLAACLGGAVGISTHAGQTDWRFWVKIPPTDEVRGFPEPLGNPACVRDYGAMLAERGVKIDPGSVETFAMAARKSAGPLAQEFAKEVLGGWEDLRRACGIPAATKASGAKISCASNWIAARIAPLVPEDKKQALAQKIAGEMNGP